MKTLLSSFLLSGLAAATAAAQGVPGRPVEPVPAPGATAVPVDSSADRAADRGAMPPARAAQRPRPRPDVPAAAPSSPRTRGDRIESVRAPTASIATFDGRLFGFGDAYRAEFGEGGVSLTPALGPDAPRSLSLRFELESVRRGDTLLYEAPVGGVSPAAEDLTVRYAHGAGITEIYDVRPGEIEQSFLFESDLGGEGDLVVRGRVSTALPERIEAQDGTLLFRDPDLGGVRIGRVTGIDAAGRTAPGSVALADDVLELALPDSFVRSAVYPLVLDPPIGPVITVDSGDALVHMRPAVSYDADHDVYLVAYEVPYFWGDVEIRARKVKGDGTVLPGTITIAPGTTEAGGISVAHIPLHDRFLVVWEEKHPSDDTWRVRCRSISAGSGIVQSNVSLTSYLPGRRWPDAGGERGDFDDEAIVVWETFDGIKGALVTVTELALPSIEQTFDVTSGAAGTDSDVAITRHGGDPGRWLVTWDHWVLDFGSLDHHDVHGRILRHDGVFLGPAKPIVADASTDQRRPDCATPDGTSFTVVYEAKHEDSLDRDIFCRRVEYVDPTTGFTTSGAEHVLGYGDEADEFEPAIDFAGTKYVVGWTDDFYGPAWKLTIYLASYAPGDLGSCIPCGDVYAVGETWVSSVSIDVCANATSDASAGDVAAAVWEVVTLGPASVKTQLFDALQGGDVVPLGGGCGNGGTFDVVGEIAIGNPSVSFRLTGADPAGTFAFLTLNLSPSFVSCGPCDFLLPTPAFGFMEPMVGGQASYDTPIPCAVEAMGVTFYAQWLSHSPGTSGCPSLVDLSLSNPIQFDIGS